MKYQSSYDNLLVTLNCLKHLKITNILSQNYENKGRDISQNYEKKGRDISQNYEKKGRDISQNYEKKGWVSHKFSQF